MTKDSSEPGGSAGFHAVHALRDLESNWEVDLAKKLEEYLLKICSGEITGEEEGHIPVNFAEAALLLQGSIQVYSRKVEYLYNLVVRALEFLSQQKSQQDHIDGASVPPEESGPCAVADEENDQFWGLDDIPAEEKNSLDVTTGKEVNLDHFIKPPANLVVLEGDCLDAAGDGGELESYLLSTTDLYQDFILLDTSDAAAVNEFLKGRKAGATQNGANRGTSTRKSYLSPTRCSGGSARKSSAAKSQRAKSNCSPKLNCSFDEKNVRPSSPAGLDNCNFGFNMDDGCDTSRDSDNSDADYDDPWRPLNPHEPGNLRVKPFRKVKALKKNVTNVTQRVSMSTLFPLAKLHGPVSPELMEMWEMRHHAHERQRDSQSSPPLYEKLRQSLINDVNKTGGSFFNSDADNDDNENDGGNPDFDMPGDAFMDEDIPPCTKEPEIDDAHVNADEAIDPQYLNSQESLEDLCRSHLNALLASIAETEKQTEMAARVSTWKQRIEHNLEEQEAHPPFDIRDYGERILDKLSLEASSSCALSFSDLVQGQEKYDVARSFSSLLQLVNNGEVDLERNGIDGGSVCYTAVNPFHVRLLKHDKKREDAQLHLPKKRGKSPTKKGSIKGDKNKTGRAKSPSPSSSSRKYRQTGLSPQANCKFSVKLGKASAIKFSPEAKRRRRSQYVEPVNLHSSG
ncbi:condensin-2 complex subunit H2 isoform X2 [Gastrolobium bilobum]|uniref:condensin-2 complex subunit H2 isoform X2 n=1 Tax=Gastrolobium bilobum TaxID=150636 RepID=UPI002AB0392A|nr:condensin-2 complex subunit H2 isoform X2 [Gastrolobium bilobum]